LWAALFGVRGEDVPPPATGVGTGTAAAAGVAVSGPRIRYAEAEHDFGRVSSGSTVRHDFVFTNTGNAVLEISNVRPGCGCTTAGQWDRLVEPGKTGVIPLQFNSSGFSGPVMKSATVTCNDPTQPNSVLQLRATVWRPIEVNPASAYFNVPSESATNEMRVVKIVNNLETPLEISPPECTNQNFRAELATIRPGKEFELRVTVQPPFSATYVQTPITLKTSSTNTPVLTVRAYANVQPAVQVVPQQIILPTGLPAGSAMPTVTIRGTGTNALVVSEPAINLEGVTLNLREVQPGRVFTLGLGLPTGMQIPSTQRVEVTLKSNHPKHPVIRVPVYQPQPLPQTPRVANPSVPRGVEGIPPLLARPATVITTPAPAAQPGASPAAKYGTVPASQPGTARPARPLPPLPGAKP